MNFILSVLERIITDKFKFVDKVGLPSDISLFAIFVCLLEHFLSVYRSISTLTMKKTESLIRTILLLS